jgi:hypothetical protein
VKKYRGICRWSPGPALPSRTRSRRLNAQQSCNEAVTPVKKSRLAGIADWARAVSLFGGGTHGNCDYNLEIHVPQAFAADVLLVSFGAEKPQMAISLVSTLSSKSLVELIRYIDAMRMQ